MKNEKIARREFLKRTGSIAGSVLLAGSILPKTPIEQGVEEYSIACEACGKNLTHKVIVSVYGDESNKRMSGPQKDRFFLKTNPSKIHYACPEKNGIGGDCSKKVDTNNMIHINYLEHPCLTGGATLSLVNVQEFLKAREH
ncbi:hypothetical protein HOE04_03580 [archaeon]|jgi:hypothetical protein|nr:hypothetical protein [archaeon]